MKLARELVFLILTLAALTATAYSQTTGEQLQQMVEQLQKTPYDSALREKIIKLAIGMKPQPAISEEARRPFVMGETLFKQGKTLRTAYEAANAFFSATTLAPWWGDAYWNLALAQQLAGQYGGARDSLRLYMLTDLSAGDRRAAQDLIYQLEANEIAASSVPPGLAGYWQQTAVQVNGEWKKQYPESGRTDVFEFQQNGSGYTVKCWKCDDQEGLGKWKISFISADTSSITFQRYFVSPYNKEGPDTLECKLDGNTLICTLNRGSIKQTQRFVKRNICEVVGGPIIDGYIVLCK